MSKFLNNFAVVFVILMFSVSVCASNTTTPKLSYKEGAPNTIVLKVSAIHNTIQIVLQNNEGGLLFTETLEKGYTYKKNYDLSDFSSGVYFIKIVEAKDVKFYKIIKGEENLIEEVDKLPFE